VIEAARQVETELKKHGVVSQNHSMPIPGRTSDPAVTVDGTEDGSDAAESRFDEQVGHIKQAMKNALRHFGSLGKTVDEAEAAWEHITTMDLLHEREDLKKAVANKNITAGQAIEALQDHYNAVIEAARQVEAELKKDGVVSQNHTMPVLEVTDKPSHSSASSEHYFATPPTPAETGNSSCFTDHAYYEEELRRVVSEMSHFLHALAVAGTTPQEAKEAWSEQVHHYLTGESQLLRHLVLQHHMDPVQAEGKLQADYRAVREAAKQVEAEDAMKADTKEQPGNDAIEPTAQNLRGQATAGAAAGSGSGVDSIEKSGSSPDSGGAANVMRVAAVVHSPPGTGPNSVGVTSDSEEAGNQFSTGDQKLKSKSPRAERIVGALVGCAVLAAAVIGAVMYRTRKRREERESGGQTLAVVHGRRQDGSPTRAVTSTNFVAMI